MSSESGWGRPSCRGFLNRSWSDRRRDAARDLARARRHPPQKWITPRLTRRCEAVARVSEAGCAPTLAARRAIHARRLEPRGSTCEVSVIEGKRRRAFRGGRDGIPRRAVPLAERPGHGRASREVRAHGRRGAERQGCVGAVRAVDLGSRGADVFRVLRRTVAGGCEQDRTTREPRSRVCIAASATTASTGQPRSRASLRRWPRSRQPRGRRTRSRYRGSSSTSAGAPRQRRRSPQSPRKSHTRQPAAIRTLKPTRITLRRDRR